MKIENRVFPVELRVEGDDEKRTIVGHAAVFNKLSLDLGGFRERIIPDAFGAASKGISASKAAIDRSVKASARHPAIAS